MAAFAACAVFVAVPAFAGGVYVDTENKFELTLPDGWITEKPADPDTKLVMNSPNKGATGGNCRVLAGNDAGTAKSSQAEIDKMLAAEINEAFWKNVFTGGANGKPIVLEKWGSEKRAANIVYFGIGVLSVEAEDKSIVQVKSKQILVWVPGRFNWVNCSVRADSAAAEEQSFETIFSSFHPT